MLLESYPLHPFGEREPLEVSSVNGSPAVQESYRSKSEDDTCFTPASSDKVSCDKDLIPHNSTSERKSSQSIQNQHLLLPTNNKKPHNLSLVSNRKRTYRSRKTLPFSVNYLPAPMVWVRPQTPFGTNKAPDNPKKLRQKSSFVFSVSSNMTLVDTNTNTIQYDEYPPENAFYQTQKESWGVGIIKEQANSLLSVSCRVPFSYLLSTFVESMK